MLVWNPETFFRLRSEVGPSAGMNLDPSHLFWKGACPIAQPGPGFSSASMNADINRAAASRRKMWTPASAAWRSSSVPR